MIGYSIPICVRERPVSFLLYIYMYISLFIWVYNGDLGGWGLYVLRAQYGSLFMECGAKRNWFSLFVCALVFVGITVKKSDNQI